MTHDAAFRLNEVNEEKIWSSMLPSIRVGMFLRLKRWHPIEELIAQNSQAPNINTSIMFYTFHWKNTTVVRF